MGIPFTLKYESDECNKALGIDSGRGTSWGAGALEEPGRNWAGERSSRVGFPSWVQRRGPPAARCQEVQVHVHRVEPASGGSAAARSSWWRTGV